MRQMTLLLAFVTALSFGSDLQAQQAQDQEVRQELRALVTQGDEAEADRAAVAEFLERGDVERVAAQRGIDVDRLKDGVATLGSEEAGDLAERVREVQDQLAGGDTFVITSTTIIIALLVIILIIVA